MGKYFTDTTRHAKAQEFLELKQGAMTVMDYVARFTELARFSDDYVATGMAKVRRFENVLKLSIRARIVGLRLQDMDSMVGRALDKPKMWCVKCTPMCASAHVSPSNIVYQWYGYRSTGIDVLTTEICVSNIIWIYVMCEKGTSV